MGIRINSNTAAMDALRNLGRTQGNLSDSVSRLSSGLRINSAADDPAGLIISEGMRTQIKGIDQAIRNSQDAVNLAKTAEASLSEVQTLLLGIRALAVHAANSAVVDSAQLQADQSQIASTTASIDRIGQQTQWGTKKLLDGTAGVLANVTDVADVSSIYVGGTWDGLSVATGPVTMSRQTSGSQALVTLGKTFANANAIVTTVGSFVINGYSFASDGTESLASLVAKMNAMSGTTGVTAQIAGGGPVQVVLRSNDFGSQFSVNAFDPSQILHNAPSGSSTGTDAVFTVTLSTTSGARPVTMTGGRGPKESGLRLSDTYGNTVTVTQAGNLGLGVATQVGVITAGAVKFQIGPNGNQSVSYGMPVIASNRLGTGIVSGQSLATLDVTTQQGAQNAIAIIDGAVTQLALMRGGLGSFQTNYLESNVRSLEVAKQNMAASESQIRDVDMAEEITNLTRLQILQQSGTSMLAQANQIPQSILSLLRQ